MQKRLENWVPFPRKIANDYRNGIITRDEYFIYSWLRLNADAFGVSTTSLDNLSNDVLRKKNKKNYVNKLLLSLKEKRFIYYSRRTGRRGTFDVHLGDFILPNKVISNLDKFFKKDLVRGDDTLDISDKSEPEQNLSARSQNLNDIKSEINSLADTFSINKQIRTYNNDNNKEKDNISSSLKERTNLSDFVPKNSDEECCLNIATKLDEQDINFLLSVLKKYGRETIEKAWRIFQEEEQKTTIKNRGAYFNTLVKRIYNQGN